MIRNRSLMISLVVALGPALFLWLYSDSPPYGYPSNELSNGYWGMLIDIAHKWRGLDFYFWDRGVYGGTSLFVSGSYPILDPTNFFSFFLNDDSFFLLNLIEPYFFGVLFMHVLLWRQYKFGFLISVFGSLLYMGSILVRHSGVPGQPMFLWGPALFPLVILAIERYLSKDIFLTAALVGAVVGLLFAVGGTTQIPQTIIWWSIFLFFYLFTRLRPRKFISTGLKWLMCVSLCLLLAIGLFGIQFFPTLDYVFEESIFRTSRLGNYPINSFPLWGSAPPHNPLNNLSLTLTELLSRAVISPTGVSGYGIVALVFGAILITSVNFRQVREGVRGVYHLPGIWIATIAYVVLPTAIMLIGICLPFLRSMLNIFSTFTFYYALHMLDLCVVLTLCVFLNNDKLILFSKTNTKRYLVFMSALVALIIGYLFLPLLAELATAFVSTGKSISNVLSLFKPAHTSSTIVAIFVGIVSLFFLLVRPKRKLLRIGSQTALIVLAFMTFITSYNWNDKGSNWSDRGKVGPDYCWTCPEHEYFRASAGKFFWTLDNSRPAYMSGHYPLLYGVHSMEEFMALDPKRFSFVRDIYRDKSNTIDPPKYFPINFTVIDKDEPLKWDGFRLVVKGALHDVYERVTKPTKVFFSSELEIAPIERISELVENVLFSRSGGISTPNIRDDEFRWFVSEADISKDFLELPKDSESFDRAGNYPYYEHYISERIDSFQFNVITPYPTYVLISEMYRKGWKVRVDGKVTETAPMNYIFLGFKLPSGEHNVEVRFVPPNLLFGGIINILALLVVVLLCYRYKVGFNVRPRIGKKAVKAKN